MDWVHIITTVTGLLAGGSIGGVFLFRETKRTAQLRNEALASEEWRKLYHEKDDECKECKDEIKLLNAENKGIRDDNNKLTTDNAILLLQKCEVNGCDRRIPPRGW